MPAFAFYCASSAFYEVLLSCFSDGSETLATVLLFAECQQVEHSHILSLRNDSFP